MASATWRERAARVIAETLAALPKDADERTCKKALRDAYPFGERESYPYTVWCDEMRRSLALRFRRFDAFIPKKRFLKPIPDDPAQMGLF